MRTLALAVLAGVALTGCPSAHVPTRAGRLEPHPEPELIVLEHRVAKGETLYRLARRYGVTVEALAEANGLDDAGSLAIGALLIIPGADPTRPEETVEEGVRGAGLGSDGEPEPGLGRRTPGTGPESSPRPARPPRPTERGAVGRSGAPFEWPLRGILYARFGPRAGGLHDGIDLSAPEGTPIRVAAPGRVLFAGEQRGYGRLVIVEHEPGLHTLYAHNRDLRVREGQEVRAGQVVATVGATGRTSGPHLHFEVRVKGVPVDPLGYLGPVPSRAE